MNAKTFSRLFLKFIFFNLFFRIDYFVYGVARKYDLGGKRLLDIGAGNSPYRLYFKNLEYLTQDIRQNKANSIDYVGDINAGLGAVSDESMDYILCTQVLEHLKKPEKAFSEFQRILKPGGKVFLSTNFIYEEHMIPDDYFRFTGYGLVYLGESNGFEVEHIRPHGGVFSVLSYVIIRIPIFLGMKRDSVFYYLYFIIFSIPIVILNLLCYLLDFLDRKKTLALNYEVVYRKK